MTKKIVALIAAIFLLAGAMWRQATYAQSQSNPLAGVFSAAEKSAALHKDLENRTRALASKASVVAQRAANFQPSLLKYEVDDIRDGASRLPSAVRQVKGSMDALQVEMRRTGLFPVFYGKLKIWNADYAKLKGLNEDLQGSLQSLQTLPADPKDAAPLLQKPAEDLEKMSATSKKLHTDYQVMANILEIFQQVPASLVTAPRGRVFGETWLQHEERTGEWGIADPMHPTSNFSAHSLYAIRDHKKSHVVWADEANILDFLIGRVKGQDHPYINSADTPYCQRCHTARAGKHNFTWCRPSNSKTMIDACNVLEKTAH